MTTFIFGQTPVDKNTVKLKNQNIGSNLVIGDPVYRDSRGNIFSIDVDVEDSGGHTDATIRQVIPASLISSNAASIQISFKAGIAEGFKVDNCSIVEQSSGADGVTTPTELLFNAISGFDIAAGQTIESDELSFVIDKTKNYLVIMDVNVATGTDTTRKTTVGTTASTFIKAATNSYNTSTLVGATEFTNTHTAVVGIKLTSGDIWNQATDLTPVPTGVYAGNLAKPGHLEDHHIVLSGLIEGLTGLQAGSLYYVDDNIKVESDADIFFDDFNALQGWTDLDTGTGVSSQVVFEAAEVLKLDQPAAASADAEREKIITNSIPNKFSFSIRVHNVNTGSVFFLQSVSLSGVSIQPNFSDTDLRVFDGDTQNIIGTNLVTAGVWTTWTYDVDASIPSTSTCDIYKDGILVATGVDCSNTGTFTAGTINLNVNSTAGSARLTYVDFIKIGSSLKRRGGLSKDNKQQVKIGQALSSTELLVDIETPGISSQSSKAGYLIGETSLSVIKKLEFSTESFSVLTSVIAKNGKRTFGGGSSPSTGYQVAGGPTSPINYSIVEALTFSNSSNRVLSIQAEQEKTDIAKSNNKIQGYAFGGIKVGNVRNSNIEKLIFSTESLFLHVNKFSEVKQHSYGPNSEIAGYVAGTWEPVSTTNTEKLVFATDNVSSLGSDYKRVAAETISNLKVCGYFIGGATLPASPDLSEIDKLNFSNDSITDVVSVVNKIGAVDGSGKDLHNSSKSGYIVLETTKVDKLEFSNENIGMIASFLPSTADRLSGGLVDGFSL